MEFVEGEIDGARIFVFYLDVIVAGCDGVAEFLGASEGGGEFGENTCDGWEHEV